MSTRAQTTQDFAIGASVFLLTMAFVFALIPTVFAPFQTPVTSADTVASQRIADSVQGNITDEGVTLDDDAREAFFDDTSGDDLRETYGLGRSTNVNVTLTGEDATGDRVVIDSTGDAYGEEPVVISRRTVVDASGDPQEIEVRVW